MFTLKSDFMREYEQRHMELIQEAQRHNLVKEALKAGMPKTRNTSTILAQIGRALVAVGTRLEQRYSVQPCNKVAVSQ